METFPFKVYPSFMNYRNKLLSNVVFVHMDVLIVMYLWAMPSISTQ